MISEQKELREKIIDAIIETKTAGEAADRIIEIFKMFCKQNNFMYIGSD